MRDSGQAGGHLITVEAAADHQLTRPIYVKSPFPPLFAFHERVLFIDIFWTPYTLVSALTLC